MDYKGYIFNISMQVKIIVKAIYFINTVRVFHMSKITFVEDQCEPDICDRVDCRNVVKEDCKANETFDKNGGYCGCCPACVPKPGKSKCILNHFNT